jgi:hypothetical protein
LFGSIVTAAWCALATPGVLAQTQASARPVPATAVEEGPRWRMLSPAQRSVLQPLERDWATTSDSQKRKWLEIAARYPSLPAAERERISARMNEWTKLTPAERGQARLNYQEAKQIHPQERQARWEAYQALSPEQRRDLTTRAVPPAPAAPPGRASRSAAAVGLPRDATQSKSNIVPNPQLATPPRAVAPTVVQARPGATTSLMSQRPVPPSHLQTGMPKIAAAPGFVDKSTLLPQRGAQGAATRSAAASDARSTPAR